MTSGPLAPRPDGRYTRRAALRQLSGAVLGAALAPGALAVSPAKDTVFGLELIPANFPVGTMQDLVNALALCAVVGGHVSKVLHWDDTTGLSGLETWGPLASRFGLKSIWQLAPAAVGTPSPPSGYGPSFADPATRQRYLSDVERLAALRPDRLVLITEANLMYRFKPAEFQAYRSLYTQAYARAKAISPSTLVGASWQHTIWYVEMTQDFVDTPALLQPQDFLGITSYPDSLVLDQAFASIESIPAGWFGAIRDRYPQADIAITETAWSSSGTNGLERQAAYVRELPRLLSTLRPSSVSWALQQDVGFFRPELLSPAQVALLEGLGVDAVALFSRFNSMGLIDDQNRAKPSWDAAMSLVFGPPPALTHSLRR